jgi:hypothetical protein
MYPSQSTQWAKQQGKRAIAPPTASEVAAVLRWIPTAPDYDTWVRIVSAVGNTLPEAEAEALLLAWSPDQKPGETLRKLRSRMTRVVYGSLIYQARQHGYAPKPCNRHKGPFRRHSAPKWPQTILMPPSAPKARKSALSGTYSPTGRESTNEQIAMDGRTHIESRGSNKLNEFLPTISLPKPRPQHDPKAEFLPII